MLLIGDLYCCMPHSVIARGACGLGCASGACARAALTGLTHVRGARSHSSLLLYHFWTQCKCSYTSYCGAGTGSPSQSRTGP